MVNRDISKKIRIVVVGGIRTHYIKIHAIQKIFSKLPQEIQSRFDVLYVNVGQHYDYALTCHIETLGVHFDYTLQHESKEVFNVLSNIFNRFGELLDAISLDGKIDYVVVMGDVATTAVSALVAVIKSIYVVHIESGGRIGRGNGNEEYYRTVADHCATLCFASTPESNKNLFAEGLGERSYFSGDIMYDYVKDCYQKEAFTDFGYIIGTEYKRYEIRAPYILSSLHHVENIDANLLQNLFTVLDGTEYDSIFIAHPRIKKFIADNRVDTCKTLVVEAIPYQENLKAIKNSIFCFTDSGGIQREAYYFNKRCIVCSDLTVWRSIVKTGSNIQIGKTLDELKRGIKWAEQNANIKYEYNGCFGDGHAVQTIFETILKHYETI